MALDLKGRVKSVPRWGWFVIAAVMILAYLHARKVRAAKEAAAMAAARRREQEAQQQNDPGAHPELRGDGAVVSGASQWTTAPMGPPEQLPPMPPPTPAFAGASMVDESFFGTGGPILSGGQYWMDTFHPEFNHARYGRMDQPPPPRGPRPYDRPHAF